KPGKHDNWPATSGRQANGLAGLQCDTMSDDARISKFSDRAIRQVARPLAGASGEQHDIGGVDSLMEAVTRFREIVAGYAQSQRLAAHFANCIGENLRIRVVYFRRLHRLAWSDDFVAGGEDGHDRFTPDVDAADADGG